MKKEKKYIEYILKQAEALLAIDSPSGFTEKVTDYLCEEYKRLGYKPVKTKKGGVLVEIGGKGNAILTMAHVDTLGGMVAEIKSNGRLRLTRVGLNANNIETENCRIYTLDGKVYDGTVQLTDASIHVNDDYQKSERTFDSVEVLLDEKRVAVVPALAFGDDRYVRLSYATSRANIVEGMRRISAFVEELEDY